MELHSHGMGAAGWLGEVRMHVMQPSKAMSAARRPDPTKIDEWESGEDRSVACATGGAGLNTTQKLLLNQFVTDCKIGVATLISASWTQRPRACMYRGSTSFAMDGPVMDATRSSPRIRR